MSLSELEAAVRDLISWHRHTETHILPTNDCISQNHCACSYSAAVSFHKNTVKKQTFQVFIIKIWIFNVHVWQFPQPAGW